MFGRADDVPWSGDSWNKEVLSEFGGNLISDQLRLVTTCGEASTGRSSLAGLRVDVSVDSSRMVSRRRPGLVSVLGRVKVASIVSL